MRCVLTAFVCAGLLIGGSPSRAEPVDDAPASVKSCEIVPATIAPRGASTQEIIRVSFRVDRAVPADVARFTVTSPSGAFRDFTARGSFAQGTVIADRVVHADPPALQQFASLGTAPAVRCTVSYLHFADGTSWTPRPPLHVASCSIIPSPATPRSATQQLIRVSYTIETGPAADEATFTIKTPHGDLTGFTARGSFSRGTAIADRIVAADAAQEAFASLGSSADCDVSYVHFVDGTTWSAARP